MWDGESATAMPAASRATRFDSAVPAPPEMIAPAWPIRRPGGAVKAVCLLGLEGRPG